MVLVGVGHMIWGPGSIVHGVFGLPSVGFGILDFIYGSRARFDISDSQNPNPHTLQGYLAHENTLTTLGLP